MITEWAKLLPWNLITGAAKAANVDVGLVAAIVMQESGGRAWVTRYEPAYMYLYNVAAFAQLRGIDQTTETVMQKMSWGLMQIMGGVAREIGYKGDLTELSRPSVGLRWSCEKLAKIISAVGVAHIEDVVATWNGGPGGTRKNGDGSYAVPAVQKYVVSVMRLYSQVSQIET